MSWWDDGPDILGDGPADELKAAWRRILGERRQAGVDKPRLDEALDAYARALRQIALSPPLKALVLLCDGQPEKTFSGEADAPADLVAAFGAALPTIVQDYQRTLQRPPTPSEAAKIFEFLVFAAPEIYLSAPSDGAYWEAAALSSDPRSVWDGESDAPKA